MPEDWRPLKLEGTPDKGTMMIGDAEHPIVLVQWWRPGRDRRFDPDAWLDQRFRKLGAAPSRKAPAPAGFSKKAWVRELASRDGGHKTVWSGYSKDACLVLEVIVTSLTEDSLRDLIFASLVPAIRVSPPESPCLWSMYDVSFLSPPGLELARKHLFSGDIALAFRRGRAESLLVRQVYPAGLALSRRPLEAWLNANPFRERRRSRNAVKDAWRRDTPRRIEGISTRGWKRLPSPLGFCAPRYSRAVAVVDKTLDRILIAESQARTETGGSDVDWIVEHMNAA